MKKKTLQFIAFVTALVFTVTQVNAPPGWGSPSVIARSGGAATKPASPAGGQPPFEVPLPQSAFSLSLPPELGTIEEFYSPQSLSTLSSNENPAPFVIHIQDAHTSPEAQKKVRDILKHLQTALTPTLSPKGRGRSQDDSLSPKGGEGEGEGGTRMLIALEGALGPLYPELLDLFPEYPKVNDAVVSDLAEEGVLSGAELLAWERYRQLSSLRASRSEAKQSQRLLRRPAKMIGGTPRNDEQIQFAGVETPELYAANLRAYRRVFKNEANVKKELEAIRQSLELEQSKILNPKLLKWVREVERRKEGRFDSGIHSPNLTGFVRFLADQAFEHLQIDLRDRFEQIRFPHLTRLLFLLEFEKKLYPREREILQSEIKVKGLMEEIGALEQGIREKLIQNEDERTLLERLDHFKLLKKLLRLELTREEYQAVIARSPASRDLAMTNAYAAALRFYRLAERRDQALLENALQKVQTNQVLVLITGGFHTEGLSSLMRKKQIPCAVITPRLTSSDFKHTRYHELMMGETSHLAARLLLEQGLRDQFGIDSPPPSLLRVLGDDLTRSELRKHGLSPEQISEAIKTAMHELYSSYKVPSSRAEVRSETKEFADYSELAHALVSQTFPLHSDSSLEVEDPLRRQERDLRKLKDLSSYRELAGFYDLVRDLILAHEEGHWHFRPRMGRPPKEYVNPSGLYKAFTPALRKAQDWQTPSFLAETYFRAAGLLAAELSKPESDRRFQGEDGPEALREALDVESAQSVWSQLHRRKLPPDQKTVKETFGWPSSYHLIQSRAEVRVSDEEVEEAAKFLEENKINFGFYRGIERLRAKPIETWTEEDWNVVKDAQRAYDWTLGWIHRSSYYKNLKGHPPVLLSLEGIISAVQDGMGPRLTSFHGGLGVLFGEWIRGLAYLGGVTTFKPDSEAPEFMIFIPNYQRGVAVSQIDPFGYPETDAYASTRPQNYGIEFFKKTPSDARPLQVKIPLYEDKNVTVHFRVVKVGALQVVMPETDANEAPLDQILGELYQGTTSSLTRFVQEWIAGLSAYEFRKKLGISQEGPIHLNETATFPYLVGLIRGYMEEGKTYDEALQLAGGQIIFFTHTLVSAGIDKFNKGEVALGDFIRRYFERSSEATVRKQAGDVAGWMIGGKWSAILDQRKPSDQNLPDFRHPKQGVVYSPLNFIVKLAHQFNGSIAAVSQLNAMKAGDFFVEEGILTREQVKAKPVVGITNGVDHLFWMDPRMARVMNWQESAPQERTPWRILNPRDPLARKVVEIVHPGEPLPKDLTDGNTPPLSDEELRKITREYKEKAIQMVRETVRAQYLRNIRKLEERKNKNIASEEELKRLYILYNHWLIWTGREYHEGDAAKQEFVHLLDPSLFLVVWARRIVEYKRMLLAVFGKYLPWVEDRMKRNGALSREEMDELFNKVNQESGFEPFLDLVVNQKVQFVFAGKTFSDDGRSMVALLHRVIERLAQTHPEIQKRVVFLEGYDETKSQSLVRGANIWLNTPKRPLEASGTSGMKVQGAVNYFAALDGWGASGINSGFNGQASESPRYVPRDHPDLWGEKVLDERPQSLRSNEPDPRDYYLRVEAENLRQGLANAAEMYYSHRSDWLNLLRRSIYYLAVVYDIRGEFTGRSVPSFDKEIPGGYEPGILSLYDRAIRRLEATKRYQAIKRSLQFESTPPQVSPQENGFVTVTAKFKIDPDLLADTDFYVHWGPYGEAVAIPWFNELVPPENNAGDQGSYTLRQKINPEIYFLGAGPHFGVTVFAVPKGLNPKDKDFEDLIVWRGEPGRNAIFTRAEVRAENRDLTIADKLFPGEIDIPQDFPHQPSSDVFPLMKRDNRDTAIRGVPEEDMAPLLADSLESQPRENTNNLGGFKGSKPAQEFSRKLPLPGGPQISKVPGLLSGPSGKAGWLPLSDRGVGGGPLPGYGNPGVRERMPRASRLHPSQSEPRIPSSAFNFPPHELTKPNTSQGPSQDSPRAEVRSAVFPIAGTAFSVEVVREIKDQEVGQNSGPVRIKIARGDKSPLIFSLPLPRPLDEPEALTAELVAEALESSPATLRLLKRPSLGSKALEKISGLVEQIPTTFDFERRLSFVKLSLEGLASQDDYFLYASDSIEKANQILLPIDTLKSPEEYARVFREIYPLIKTVWDALLYGKPGADKEEEPERRSEMVDHLEKSLDQIAILITQDELRSLIFFLERYLGGENLALRNAQSLKARVEEALRILQPKHSAPNENVQDVVALLRQTVNLSQGLIQGIQERRNPWTKRRRNILRWLDRNLRDLVREISNKTVQEIPSETRKRLIGSDEELPAAREALLIHLVKHKFRRAEVRRENSLRSKLRSTPHGLEGVNSTWALREDYERGERAELRKQLAEPIQRVQKHPFVQRGLRQLDGFLPVEIVPLVEGLKESLTMPVAKAGGVIKADILLQAEKGLIDGLGQTMLQAADQGVPIWISRVGLPARPRDTKVALVYLFNAAFGQMLPLLPTVAETLDSYGPKAYAGVVAPSGYQEFIERERQDSGRNILAAETLEDLIVKIASLQPAEIIFIATPKDQAISGALIKKLLERNIRAEVRWVTEASLGRATQSFPRLANQIEAFRRELEALSTAA